MKPRITITLSRQNVDPDEFDQWSDFVSAHAHDYCKWAVVIEVDESTCGADEVSCSCDVGDDCQCWNDGRDAIAMLWTDFCDEEPSS
jgi:hypothetical protein